MKSSPNVWWVALCVVVLAGFQTGCESKQPPKKDKTPTAKPAADAKTKPADDVRTQPSEDAKTKPADDMKTKPADEAKPKPADEAKPKPADKAEIKPPLGLPALPVPADNPITPEKIELGKMLYFDTRLSANGKISCATCHDPKMAWAEHTPTSKGINDQMGGRNSPTVINAAYAPAQFWDGRAASLEEQALGPIENPIEMGHKLPAMIQDLSKVPQYGEMFKKAFGTEVNKEGVAKAIATFERTVLSGNSPYDRYMAGDKSALSEAQKRGMELFDGKGTCGLCHTPPKFSGYQYQNAGVGMDKKEPDPGRKAVTGKDSDLGKFRVPQLREVANTAPYFHDGSVATLEAAVALMATGGKDNPNLSPIFKSLRDAGITEQEQKDLVEFLKALSGEYPIVEAPKLP
jgi:cytochrome c peroxidase